MEQGKSHVEAGAICLANRLSELERLHAFFDEIGHRFNWGKSLRLDLTLTCDELLTNTINYGFPLGGDHVISLAVHMEPGWVELRIEDDGIPFNPFEREQPNLSLGVEEREIGGLGIFFVQQIMDEVKYERTFMGNRLILRKSI